MSSTASANYLLLKSDKMYGP